ncbi:MAG: lysophospholipid acyltransferase family protein [Rikenellaceae bacterium]|nr:lysophospholipid acyltransferase family protein [Rikenellaceae bacterium]
MNLIEREDLRFGRKGVAARAVSGLLMGLLGIGKVNRLYARTLSSGEPAARTILSDLQITADVAGNDNIPATGGAIVVANHPTGALDGILLIDVLTQVRPDVKFMGNFLLDKIESMKQYFIAVDPFDGADMRRNVHGIRESLAHVAAGGLLVIFPAGEVATWRRGFGRVGDKRWSPSVVRTIRRAGVPVVPLYINARNSALFHLAGKIHPMLRTALLPHELFNKRGRRIAVTVGSPLTVRKAEELGDLKTYGDFLRANVEYMQDEKRPKRRKLLKRRIREVLAEEVIGPVDTALLQAEIDAIRADHKLFDYGAFEVFFTPPQRIPQMMTEIGRQREITFRAIGEGTMRRIDLDKYDTYYNQLFIWDREASRLVGAYRVGLGDAIMREYGLAGFYTNSLFRMSPGMAPVMEQTIELGRSFIVQDYQRKPATLLLLWRGILYVLLKHGQFRNLLGPVTISGEFRPASKRVLVRYIRRYHYNAGLARHIRPLTGLAGIRSRIDLRLIDGVDDIELIGKLVGDIERGRLGVPILIKKYLQLNSHVLAFNVDHEFCDALDALMLLDLKKVPDDTIQMVSKEITGIDVMARFRSVR